MNQREYREILFNSSLAPLQKLLYAYLRSCMDWETCVVGDAGKKLISYQSIREHLEYHPPRGSQASQVDLSRDQVKRLLAGLVADKYIVRLKGLRYGVELRFFLPLASTGQVRPEEDRHMSAIAGAPQCISGAQMPVDRAAQGVDEIGGYRNQAMSDPSPPYHERHTSLVLLSPSNKYIYYDPDDDDMSWMRYLFGGDLDRHKVDVACETEKFNLRCEKQTGYDMTHQRADWRVWMIRAMEYSRGAE